MDLDQELSTACELLARNSGLRSEQHGCRSTCRKPRRRRGHRDAPGVKTHLRHVIILPGVVGCMVGIYNGKTFNQVEIKPEMISHSLGEFSVAYNPVTSGPPTCPNSLPSSSLPAKRDTDISRRKQPPPPPQVPSWHDRIYQEVLIPFRVLHPALFREGSGFMVSCTSTSFPECRELITLFLSNLRATSLDRNTSYFLFPILLRHRPSSAVLISSPPHTPLTQAQPPQVPIPA